MELQEYIESFTNDVQADADTYQISIEEAFMSNIAEKLVENETISEYETGYFKKRGRSNRQIEINGFNYEESDGTFNLFIVDDLNEKSLSLTNTRIDALIKRAEELVYCGIETRFLEWEESSTGYEVASQIYRLYNNRLKLDIDYDLKKVRIFVLTNKSLSNRFKNVKREDIYEVPVEFSVYDATKIYDMAKAGFEKEPVDILLEDYGTEGILAIKCTSKDDEFDSFLAPIPGEVLANIYLRNGAQVLEGNVRSFLSVRGKVNKGIRKTILSEPEKFFLLNNGITVTSSGISYENTSAGLQITKINDLQIVNGGQTTASLANAIMKEKADLSNVLVMMKLSVLANHEIVVKLVPEISRASNSQNKVDEADFFSNHPYHVKIEELSKKILAPAVDGNQYQTIWFYERARGQYTVAQMKLTKAQSKAYQLKNPKKQVIKKTDLAKFLMSYEGLPHEVSKGAQSVMKKFSTHVQGSDGEGGFWEKDSSSVNEKYFKELIAKAIIFKETEKLVSSLEWYKEVKAYRANIVTYTIAILATHAKKKGKNIDLNKIWNNQHMYESLINQIKLTSKWVYDFLTGPREVQNVTEWAKKEKCWKKAQEVQWQILPDFEDDLIPIHIEKKTEITEKTVNAMNFIVEKDEIFWREIMKWGKKYLYLTPREEGFLELAVKIHTHGKIPSERQFAEIIRIYNSMVSKGFKEQEVDVRN
ncbi:AIPR family protein [Marinilactibacillus psychrotolerans]|uniref:AIPR family protein n=1 Tax=Marinilactibacillus psychrotolerans TaxID=191770 RepID=UPI00388639FE